MVFNRGQTQVLYSFLPGAIFEHDDYGFCRVTGVELREERINRGALFDALSDLLYQWQDEALRAGYADPRDERNRRGYVVGTPTVVRFEPYPTLLECRGCERVFRLRDLTRRRMSRAGYCPECGGVLGQLRYVQAHNCGRIEQLYYPRCPRHGTAYLRFFDTGRVASARWLCGACGGAEIARLRMTPCNCAYSTRVADSQWERGLKTFAVTDPALYMAQVVPFINFDEGQEQSLYGDPQSMALLLARTWGLLSEPVTQVFERRRRARSEEATEIDDTADEMARQLEQMDPENPLVKRWREQQRQRTTPAGQEAVERIRSLMGTAAPADGSAPPRQLVEHVAILDTLDTTEVATAAGWARERGDLQGAADLQEAERVANADLGIADIRVINDFPAALCTAGYTRVTKDPRRSMLTPFETDDPQNRTPLYVVAAETEGVYLRLDPIRVSSWLVHNGFVEGPPPGVAEEAWAWLYTYAPGLLQHPWQPEYGDAPAVAVRTLLHTISHALLRHVEWSGFSSNSIGEYLLPGVLWGVLYANRYAETKIGGLTALFEQRLDLWMSGSASSARECVYDPFCTDEGGACVGCLHREYNCPQFNRELSRAVLYGGPTPQEERSQSDLMGVATINVGYWEGARPFDVTVSEREGART